MSEPKPDHYIRGMIIIHLQMSPILLTWLVRVYERYDDDHPTYERFMPSMVDLLNNQVVPVGMDPKFTWLDTKHSINPEQ